MIRDRSILANRLAGPLGYVVVGTLFVHAGLPGTYAVVAGLATFASVKFIVAAPGLESGQEAA